MKKYLVSLIILITLQANAQITTYPYHENWDNGAGGWTVVTTNGTAWELGIPTAAGALPSYSSPNCWGTDLDSGYRAGTTTYLTSPQFNLTGLANPFLQFYQFRYLTTGLDGMRMEFSINNGSTWNTLGTFGSTSSINWYNSSSLFSTNLPGWTGNSNGWVSSGYQLNGIGNPTTLKIRFIFNSNFTFGSSQPGIFVDNFSIIDSIGVVEDLQNSGIISPQSIALVGSNQPLKVVVLNSGSFVIDSITTGYQINSGVWIQQTIPFTLLPSETDTLTLGTITIPSSAYTLCTFARSTNESNASNDSSCSNLNVYIPATLPFFDNFDGASLGWSTITTGDPMTNWELGTPNYGLTTGTYSGINSWDINLTTSYQGNANTELISPEFDFTAVPYSTLSFWQNRNSEQNWDGMRMDYSYDGGLSWYQLGYYQDPLGVNWYTHSSLSSSGQPGWDGSSAGWIKSAYDLASFNGINPVKFRFVFTSDLSIATDGVSIDDFGIRIPFNNDAEIKYINSPLNNLQAGSATAVSINFKNVGTQNITNIDFGYSINNGIPVTATTNIFLAPGSNFTYTFPTNMTVPAGNYSICVWTNLINDGDHTNDTICLNLTGIQTLAIPYFCDFEGSSNTFYVETPGNILTQWQLGFPNYGSTNSTYSGINCWDINLNTYYYANSLTYLYTPYFDLTSAINPTLSFWQNRGIEPNLDGCILEYSTASGVWSTLGILNDPNGVNWYNNYSAIVGSDDWDSNSTGWIKSSINIANLTGLNNVQFRFKFISNSNGAIWPGISIDDFSIQVPVQVDAELSSISPSILSFPAGTSIPTVNIYVKNTGQQTINNFSVSYRINGVLQQTAFFTGTLNPNFSTVLSLPGFISPSGSYSLCASINLVGDLNNTNDSLCLQGSGIPILIPEYTDNFDGANVGWTTQTLGDPLTNWELGTPSYGTTNNSLSSPNSWDINLSTAYSGSANCNLYTPYFDLNNAVTPRLEFWQNRNTEASWDGMRIDYSINGGTNWQVLGIFNDPSAVNWYTNASLNSSVLPGWDGLSTGWVKSEYPLDQLGPINIIQFRFVFTSDVSVVTDGVSIDNFGIFVAYTEDATLETFNSPGTVATIGSSVPVEVVLKNKGSNSITNLNITYRHNGGSPVTYNWTGNLSFGSTANVVLPSIIVAGGTNTIQAYIDWPSDLNANNDTIYHSFQTVLLAQLPFSDDFENGNIGWNSENAGAVGTLWEFGTPNFGATNSAHSGSNCWDINLLSPYSSLANARLYSPYFDLSQSLTSELRFWLNYESEFFQDGLRIEYTINGINWQVLGTLSDPNGVNWYNGTINPQSKPGWSGNSGGWLQSIYNTQTLNGNSLIQFRFVFTSDISLSGAGVSMDDFSMTQTVGLNEQESNNAILLYPNPVKDLIQIELTNNNSFKGSITLYDAGGKIISIDNLAITTTNSKIELSTKGLTPGLYLISIYSEQGHFSKSFVKE